MCDTTYVIDNSKRHYNSLKEENEESESSADSKKVGYEVSFLVFLKFLMPVSRLYNVSTELEKIVEIGKFPR